jgi:hypothetical protein
MNNPSFTECFGMFPPGTQLLALPSWRRPRLVVPKSGGPIRRWHYSGFYPATRWMARAYRLMLRSKIALGCGEVRKAEADRWFLPEFINGSLPPVDSIVIQTRPSGPAQKFTIELRDRAGTVIGYIKYATEELAQRRLTHEYEMLMRVPDKLAPTPLKFGKIGSGLALLMTPIRGPRLTARLPPLPEVLEFTKSLEVRPALPLAAHPYIRALRDLVGARSDIILEELTTRSWPVVFQHGDFAPWNLRRDPVSNRLSAFDWEFGTLDGFPYIDLAYFILQVGLLVYTWPPVKTAIYTTQWLQKQPPRLTQSEARAVVRLATLEAYLRGKDEDQPDDDPTQAWRLRIWRGLW